MKKFKNKQSKDAGKGSGYETIYDEWGKDKDYSIEEFVQKRKN